MGKSRHHSPHEHLHQGTSISSGKEKHTDHSHERVFIKPEPPENVSHKHLRSGSPKHRHTHRKHRHMSEHGSPHSTESERHHNGRRIRSPIVIKSENGYKKRRLHSPVVLHDRRMNRTNESFHENSSNHVRSSNSQANFSRSGLLNESSLSSKQAAPVQKQRADFGLSGKLTEDTNTYKGVVIKYNEPEDARKPTEHWRLYVFKGNQTLPILHIHRQSGFLIGRDRKIADIPMDHPSISKQHAVLQYRFVRGLVRLYLIDLESANGTYLNNQKIEPRRYYELMEKDLIKFGYSSREYVVMTAQLDEDEEEEEEENPDELG